MNKCKYLKNLGVCIYIYIETDNPTEFYRLQVIKYKKAIMLEEHHKYNIRTLWLQGDYLVIYMAEQYKKSVRNPGQ